MGPAVNEARSSMRQAQGTAFDWRELADGEVSGETSGTIVFLSSTRTQEYPRLGQWLTGASSPASMVNSSGHVVARQPSLGMEGSDEDDPSTTVTYHSSRARSGHGGAVGEPEAVLGGTAAPSAHGGALHSS